MSLSGNRNHQWVKAQGLTKQSSPSDWFDKLLPEKRKPTDPWMMVTIADWCSHTNNHALLAKTGIHGHIYPKCHPFTPMEVKQFVALYILQGLSPSLQVKMKFMPHHKDPVNGNDLCYKVFGKVEREDKGTSKHVLQCKIHSSKFQ